MTVSRDAGLTAADAEALGGANLPLCREPWMSFYILRRGVMPCCYGWPVDEFITDGISRRMLESILEDISTEHYATGQDETAI